MDWRKLGALGCAVVLWSLPLKGQAGEICAVGRAMDNAPPTASLTPCTEVPHSGTGYAHTTWSCPNSARAGVTFEAVLPADFPGFFTKVVVQWATSSTTSGNSICTIFGITVDDAGTANPPVDSISGAERLAAGPLVHPNPTGAWETLYGEVNYSGGFLSGAPIPILGSGLGVGASCDATNCQNKHAVFFVGRGTSIFCTSPDPAAAELISACFLF